MLPSDASAAPAAAGLAAERIIALPLREARELFEREYLNAQIVRFGGNISRTAGFIGMERSALHRKLKSLGFGRVDRRGRGLMSRFAYVNGRFVRHGEAAVHIEDRGYQFGDGVYEVWAVSGGRLTDAEGHFARLARSLEELRIPEPMSRAAAGGRVQGDRAAQSPRRRPVVPAGLARRRPARSSVPDAGPSGQRSSSPPRPSTRRLAEAKAEKGVAVVTVPENRWGRCDIKTVNLLPNVLAKQAAKEAGAYEAWFVDELGFVTEGASTSAWIVDKEGILRTRDIQANILHGVTRAGVLQVAAEAGLALAEGPFSVADALEAREAFITGASTLVTPVIRLDGRLLAGGKVGPVAKRLRQLYIAQARRDVV